ncbi:uncharacterized protein LOC133196434 [Saccostrea echinata]|uniref:uncharacterized protein LOC133196434 n=1 Tax=Saccostrea echinata TaxID=191078 RepID=UPI002A83B7C4|nr:uncharacterized protein LOC133196434 [Saccostrea echinata]
MSKDVELQHLIKVKVITVDGKEVQVTVPVVGENEMSVTDIHTKVCLSLGLQKTSLIWFSLFCGKNAPIKRLKPESRISSTTTELCLRKWCFNKEIETQLIKDDPVACHLVYLEAKSAISSGEMTVSQEQLEKLEEYEDPGFTLKEKYVLLAHTLEDYFSVLIRDCKITDNEKNGNSPQVFNKGAIRVSLDGIRIHKDKCQAVLEWKRLKKWLIHNKLSRIILLYLNPNEELETTVIETCQCEYLLAAINQIVRELQVSSPNDSFFYSSMISTNEDGSISYENALFK